MTTNASDSARTTRKADVSGWLVIAAGTIVFIGFHGSQLSFSVFLKPLSDDFGWTRAATSGGMSILQLIFGFSGIITGLLADRYGAKIIVAAGAVIGGLGYLLMSNATMLWQLYVFFGVMGGVSLACVWIPITTMISHRFAEKRVLALGIATTGITIGQMTIAPLMAYTISSQGWHKAYLLLALIVFATAVPAVLLLDRRRTAGLRSKSAPSNEPVALEQRQWRAGEALRTMPLWMLMVTGFVISAGYYFVIAHIVAYATDIIPNLTIESATLILTVMGAASILGKVLVSPLTTRLGNRRTLFIVLAIQTIALFSFTMVDSLWLLFAAGTVFGFGFGATSPVRTSMIPELFGLRSVGTLIGVVNMAWAVGGTVGPFMAGYVFDVSRSYQTAFLCGGILMVIGTIATYFLREPHPLSIATNT